MIGSKPRASRVLDWRKQAILSLLDQRLTTWEIAIELGFSVSTVKNDVREIVWWLGAESRRHAVEIARSEGLLAVPLPQPESVGDGLLEPSYPGWELLTPQQEKIALMHADPKLAGLTERGLGLRLNISAATVKKHLQHIYRTLNIDSRYSLVAIATRIVTLQAVRAADPSVLLAIRAAE
jgi:DNA-binding NarL/FixJ family response regulator